MKKFIYKTKQLTLTLILTFATVLSFSQENVRLTGYISNGPSEETLTGVYVYIDYLKRFTSTDEFGHYSIMVPPGEYAIRLSYSGYEAFNGSIAVAQNSCKNFVLTKRTATVHRRNKK